MTQEEKLLIENYLYNKINESLLMEKSKKKDKDKKRSKVIKWLQNPSINNAEIMRQLWSPTKDDEDSKRSYFYKCRDGVLNDDGVPYRFSEEDITALHNIMSSAII